MRRKRHLPTDHSVSHERWLISYSDFVTLLFAFFVVLFATTYRDNQAIRKLSRAIHNGFQTMGAFSQDGPPTNSEFDRSSDRLQTDELSTRRPSAGSIADMQALRKQLEAALGKELKNHEIVLQMTPEGFTISLKELGFFNSGQATLLPGAADKLKRIAKVLSRPGLEIRVEGHSDNQPIHNDQFRSNWELSAARAMNVLLLLVDDAGFDPRNISASGFGEYRPVADNVTPEGRRMNRRVDLVVVQSREPNAVTDAMRAIAKPSPN
jgi:chemotaxis protein MotB